MDSPVRILQTWFGYEAFRDRQEEIIETVLAGRDAFVLMPTGGGKSLCYQIPALMCSGVTVVVSPLIALMKDQVDGLRVNGILAAYLNSTMTGAEQHVVMERLRRQEIKLLYVSPERLFVNDDAFLVFLKEVRVALFAIDEAHCVSQWGHDFRPEYFQLARLKKEFPETPVLALTATADRLTRMDIVEKLALQNPVVFVSGFNRSNIHYFVRPKQGSYEQLVEYLEKHRGESGIIYALSKKSVNLLATKLTADGFSIKPYHADLDREMRARHQESFRKDETQIIVATVAFGMGINKSNVRFVVHMNLPKNIESYYQETGRAGRDGLRSEAILFYSSQDVMTLKGFATVEGTPEQTKIMLRKLSLMADFCEARSCRRKHLLNYFGEEAPDACGSCDVCLTEYETFDGTVIAQKALSAVARLEGRFGLNYVVEFLRGSKSEKIRIEHKILKTYGVGADIPRVAWIRYIKDLIAKGYLLQTGEQYPLLELTVKSRAVLRGEERVMLIQSENAKEALSEALPHEAGLLEILKNLRREIAEREHVPAYIVFSDATLLELATYLPLTLEDLRRISGFGEVKLKRYGEEFLLPVTEYCAKHGIDSRIGDKRTSARQRQQKKISVSNTATPRSRWFRRV